MKITPYSFLFHPLAEHHTPLQKTVLIISAVALTIFTRGSYLCLIAGIHITEWAWTSTRMQQPTPLRQPVQHQSVQQQRSLRQPVQHQSVQQQQSLRQPVQHQSVQQQPLRHTMNLQSAQQRPVQVLGRVGGEENRKLVIEDQEKALKRLQECAEKGDWESLAIHSNSPGFDWWMFPVERPSSGYGFKYTVNSEDVNLLKNDKEFISRYLKGVFLVAKSWGLDGLDDETDKFYKAKPEERRWRDYDVRLGKMLSSLKQFGYVDLYNQIVQKAVEKKIVSSLREEWVLNLLQPLQIQN